MKCIFCNSSTSNSKSIEHIVPESLGNKEHILSPGIVCDKCNRYFAQKLEKPLLESDYFLQARFRNFVANKKGRVPNLKTIHLETKTIVELDPNNESIYPSNSSDVDKFLTSVLKSDKGSLIFPVAAKVDKYLMSRFLGKMAVEAATQRILDGGGKQSIILDETDLDVFRKYVRFGNSKLVWPYYEREIYPENTVFFKKDYGHYEILHEFQFMATESKELHFVIAIFGVEYTINMEAPNIISYEKWLANNANKSPLYADDKDSEGLS